jgi:hypothetical protein
MLRQQRDNFRVAGRSSTGLGIVSSNPEQMPIDPTDKHTSDSQLHVGAITASINRDDSKADYLVVQPPSMRMV